MKIYENSPAYLAYLATKTKGKVKDCKYRGSIRANWYVYNRKYFNVANVTKLNRTRETATIDLYPVVSNPPPTEE